MSTESADRDAVLVEWHELLFAVRRSRRYHMRREKFFARFHFAFGFLTIVAGSATFATILADWAVDRWFAALTVISGAIELVGQPYSRAAKHRELTQNFTRLEQEMQISESQITGARLSDLKRERLEIEVQEPPVLHVLDLICHNEEVLAGGYGSDHVRNVRWYQRLLAPFVDIQFSTIQKQAPGG